MDRTEQDRVRAQPSPEGEAFLAGMAAAEDRIKVWLRRKGAAGEALAAALDRGDHRR